MKQILSGNDWLVSHFQPDEVSAVFDYIPRIAKGELYGASFIPATVPGDVQSDAIDVGLIEEINYGYNARAAEWTSARDWVYVKRFVPASEECRRIMLCFDGVDDACEVYLNGKWLGNHEVPWIPFCFDVTEKLVLGEENSIQVIVKAAPHGECQWGATSAVRNLKPRFAYGWDWSTRLVPLGIWQDVYLRYDKEANLEDLHVTTQVDFDTKKAVITAEIETAGKQDGYCATVTLCHPNGREETVTLPIADGKAQGVFTVEDAALWWPNGMGEQPLYQIKAVIGEDWDVRSCNIGLRKIEWSRTEGAGEDALAYQPYVNGRRVYLQGYNYTPIRQLYGREHKAAYEKRLALVKESGANFLRVWGAGLLEREIFYDLCDAYGILVLQELFQSSASKNNHPPRDREYIDLLVKTAESAIMQKRNHTCLAVWCGGNELCVRGEYMTTKGEILLDGVEGNEGYGYDVSGYYWVPLDPEYPTLSALREVVEKLDPGRKWMHTSGSGPYVQNADIAFVGGKMHDVHGPWNILSPTDFYKNYNAYDMMLHAEFGCQGAASVQALEAFMSQEYLWPIDETNPMANYHGRMWVGTKTLLKPYFGELADYKTFALASRFIQWEQIRYSLEAHRRLGARCAGSCLWHMGEPWPNASDTCTIDAYDQVKPAFYGEKAAFRPIHIAAKYQGVIHKDCFEAQISLYNASEHEVSGTIEVELLDLSGHCFAAVCGECSAEADSVVKNALEVFCSDLPNGVFFLRQTLSDGMGQTICTGYSIHSTDEIPYKALLSQPHCEMETGLCGNELKLKNTGDAVASAVTVECGLSGNVIFSDGCLMLLPGEEAVITLNGFAPNDDLYLYGFGVPYRKLEL